MNFTVGCFCCFDENFSPQKSLKLSLLKTFMLFTWQTFCVPYFIVGVHSPASPVRKALFLPRMCRFQWENQSLSHTQNKKKVFFSVFFPFSLFTFCSSDGSETFYNTTTTSKKFASIWKITFRYFHCFFHELILWAIFFGEFLVLFLDLLAFFSTYFNLHFQPPKNKVISPTLSRK